MKLRGAKARALLGLAAYLLSLAILALGWLEHTENATWDKRVELLGRASEATESIVLALVDQNSLDWGEERGFSFPWPREVYAAILAFADRAGAHSVSIDILFTEPSNYAEDDERLAEALSGTTPSVVAMMLGEKDTSSDHLPERLLRRLPEVRGRIAGAPATSATLPVEPLFDAATLVADVAGTPDSDVIHRRVRLLRSIQGHVVPSLGLGAFLVSHPDLELRSEPGSLHLGATEIPLDDDGLMIVPYREADSYERFSAAAIVESELRLRAGRSPIIEPERFANRHIVIGYGAPGLRDLRSTPIDPLAPGAVVHAAVLDALLTGDSKRNLPFPVFALCLLALCLLPGLDRLLPSKTLQLVYWTGLLALPFAIALLAYQLGWWWPLVPSVLALIMMLFGSLTLAYFTEGRQKRFIKKMFRHYLSPAVIEQLISDPSRLRLGGERRELTIFFSDLAGFSSISEKLDPEDLTTLLNRFLTEMTDIILEEGGTLDKYEGDAIIAFWNAPVSQPDHAERGCRAAIRCQRRLAEIRPELATKADGMELHMRVGMHTGDVVVGNMGSRERFDYTMLGDAANLAARLEGANKAFGTETMVSAVTLDKAGDSFLARELGDLKVVGRKSAIGVYQLDGYAGEPKHPEQEAFAEALALVRSGRWAEAREIFLTLDQDGPSKRYLEEGHEGWDGIVSLQSK